MRIGGRGQTYCCIVYVKLRARVPLIVISLYYFTIIIGSACGTERTCNNKECEGGIMKRHVVMLFRNDML